MKRTLKIVLTISMVIAMISLSTFVFAAVNPNQFPGDANYNTGSLTKFGNNIIQLVSTIASIAAVLVLIVLGIKYMMGSAEEKAEYKKTLLPYILGAILVFAASSIAGIIFSFASSGLV